MKIRGRRECKECGSRWSYYETGTVSCPACESVHSVGVEDERNLHTATAATLELAPLRAAVDSEPIERLADRAVDRTRGFTLGYGFIEAGELQELDDMYLAAMELKHVAAELGRRMGVSDDEEWYFTELLRADESDRPKEGTVPDSMRTTRGLAYATAVREYRSDLRSYLREHPDPAVDGTLERLSAHIKRIHALDGDVSLRESETLVAAARDIGRYLTESEENELAAAETRLDSLG